jgi:23S rRNA (adenine2503-C2)-methyltransferase
MDFLSLSLKKIERELKLLPDFKKFRAKQIYDWLHVKRAADFSQMTNLPADLRAQLSEKFTIKQLKIKKKLVSKRQDTVKYLYELPDSNTIETVLMSHNHGNSLCISSQVGCKMSCKFCASGIAGFVRNLEPSEMLLQLYQSEKQIDSIVIMGIGEPLDNFDNLLRFLELVPLSHRHISLSTCGLADKIDELAKLKSGLTLSISLHAATDAERLAIMPINAKFPLDRLMTSCKNYFEATGRRLSFEYALINNVNDTENHAKRLIKLLSRLSKHSFHVNLIPVNEITAGHDDPGVPFKKSVNTKQFSSILEKSNINVTIRRTMGSDINAACGQLRRNQN